MILTVNELLSHQEIANVQELSKTLAWCEGSQTAGKTAKDVKNNKQADLSSRTGTRIKTLIEKRLRFHPVLQAAAQPRRFSNLILSKTTLGGGYGLHLDNAFMNKDEDCLRTDVSFTLFLSRPEDYEGGELSIEQAGLAQSVKLRAGDLVLYPSTNLHEVKPVTAGTRLVCVGWIQSQVRDPYDRELIFDLENLRASLAGKYDRQSLEMLTVTKAISNLLRRFS